MNKLFLIVFLFLSFSSRAVLISGMHSKGDTLAILYKKKLLLISLKSGKTLMEKDLSKDTSYVNLIIRKTLSKGKAVDPGSIQAARAPEITGINLTYYGQDLYLGFIYKPKGKDSSLYGIAKFDTTLKCLGVCILMPESKIYPALQPYFPLDIQQNSVLLPECDSITVRIGKYKMDFVRSECRFEKIVIPEVYKSAQIDLSNNRRPPFLYAIPLSGFKFYAVYPYPVWYSGFKTTYLNSCCPSVDPGVIQDIKGNGTYLDFNRQINLGAPVLLTYNMWNDSLFFLNNFGDTNRVSLTYFSMEAQKFTYRDFKVKPKDNYFLLANLNLYAISIKDEKVGIQRFKLYP